MSDYTFSTLNDKDFESLVNDLIGKSLNLRVERFKTGKDGGVDGRFFIGNKECIIQSKHWIKTGITQLINYLEKSEKKRVQKLNPKKYLFATSLPLSRLNKKKIKSIFYPFILSDDDIYGNEDLNDLLKKFPEIEKNHYKLWITSTGVLQNVLNSGIIGRSGFTLDNIHLESAIYVETTNHKKALDKLNDKHSVIITGSPGIGKTTLANQLSLYYAAKNFDFIFIEDSITEAEDLYNEKQMQVFYYDDFLGRNFLLALEHHQDSKIVNFIKRISKDSKKRFILTSRTNIILQGKRLSDLFDISNIEQNEFELHIDSLTKLDKAKILYNHIWFSSLDDVYTNEIFKDERYFKIIEHRNFNPRLISFITDSYRLSSINKDDYWTYIQNTLENPKDIWRTVMEVQTEDDCRNIVIGVVIHGQAIDERTLFEFINRLRNSSIFKDPYKTNDSIIKLLAGALLNRTQHKNNRIDYNLFNPSIADFVIANYLNNSELIAILIYNVQTRQTIYNLKNLLASKTIENDFFNDCISKVINFSLKSNTFQFEKPFFTSIVDMYIDYNLNLVELEKYLEINSSNFISDILKLDNYEHLDILKYCFNKGYVNNNEILEVLEESIEVEYVDEDCLKILSEIVVKIEKNENIKKILKEKIIDEYSDTIKDLIIEEGFFNEAFAIYDIDESKVYDYINEKLSAFSINFEDKDVDSICSYFDPDDIIQANIDSSMQYEDERHGSKSEDSVNYDIEIRDLFDKN